MVKQLATLPADGRNRRCLAQVFDGVADDIAGAYRPLVTGTTVARARRRDERALKDEGIVDHWRKDDDGYHLHEHRLPVQEGR